jgi:hypothetical protein
MHLVSRCFLHQAEHIATNADCLRGMFEIVGDPNSLKLHQWVHFYALTMEYQPDLIIEFGRGYGNSTCLFGEALSHMDGERRLISLCLSDCWERTTLPKLERMKDREWLARIDARTIDVRDVDYAEVVGGAKRVLVLWDAHGFDVADCVLAKLMPLIGEREHFVIMHDISDVRYAGNPLEYHGLPFWRGQEKEWHGESARLYLDWMDTAVEQSIVAIDFATRNRIELESADHRVNCDICQDSALLEKLRKTYPSDFFKTTNHWAYFTLNKAPPPYTYPRALTCRITDQRSECQTATTSGRPPEVFVGANPFGLKEQMTRDLAQHHWFGRPSPLTYARILVKMVTGRYVDLAPRK